ncbi:cell division protein FtsK [Longispora fulva]|nr:cell division protein FtsK [Longispora fulva]
MSIQPPRDSGLVPVDVVVRAQPGATVRDLAEALAEHLRGAGQSFAYLVPVTADTLWWAGQPLAECGLRNGDLLGVTPQPASWALAGGGPQRARAVLRVLAGPDIGHAVTLTGDAATVGRGHGCTVRLTDPLTSRLHCRILLDGRQPVLVDDGSSSGVLVGGAPVTGRTPVAADQQVTVGGTLFAVAMLEDTGDGSREHGVLRPPLFGEPVEVSVTAVPAPPVRAQRPHLPWAMLLLPLVTGVGLFGAGWNIAGFAMILGWPALMLLDHWLQVRRVDKEFRTELARWRADLDTLLAGLDEKARAQRDRAKADHPDLAGLRPRVLGREPALWGRRPDTEDFLTIRVGRGSVPALATGTLDDGGDRAATSWAVGELDRRRVLDDTAVPWRLADAPVTAITGPTEVVDAAARALVARLCADHSPVDLSIAAVLSAGRAGHETWLRWLPHVSRRPGGRAPVAVGAADGHLLLEELAAATGPGVTVCLVDEAAGLSRRRVEAVAGAAGLRLVWLGASAHTVPASTSAVLNLTGTQAPAGESACLAFRDRGGVTPLRAADGMDLIDAWSLARAMHPYVDEVAARSADTDLPAQVRLPDLPGDFADPDNPEVVVERWAGSRGLRAQLGLGVSGVATVDLREDGPHALLAGTTGSGKSEFLQTMLLSLALNNPPSRITFLLVDYKGGAAFRELENLPHTIGCITDLKPADVRRALVALGAEITAREELLNAYRVKDLVQMEAEHPSAAPPSLLICVDEFAALATEVPEFVEGMVNIAQRGRSLGLHLFLATQRPAGVVTANIRANTDLRIALRVASAEDSHDVLDCADAAEINRATPGRALVRRVGRRKAEPLQVAWVGAREELVPEQRLVEVRAFTASDNAHGHSHHRSHDRTDLARLVTTVNTAFAAELAGGRQREVTAPWLPPLADIQPLGRLHGGTEGTVAVGLLDDPRRREQRPLLLNYPALGHVLAYGASRAGKTELLRTLAAAGALHPAGRPVQMYCLDYAGGGLSGLADRPGVGAVIGQAETARVLRLLRRLEGTVRSRNRLLAEYDVAEVGQLPSGVRPARVHLLVDNLPALLGELAGSQILREHAELLVTVLQEGRRAGVHVTATTPSRAALDVAVQAAFGQRLVLRMTSDDDYTMLGVPTGVLHQDGPPGRGVYGGLEFQLAVSDPATPAAPIDPANRPMAIPPLPNRVHPDSLPAPTDWEILIGLDADQVEPVGTPLRGTTLLVAGRKGSGRSSVLAGIAAQARRAPNPPEHVVYLRPGDAVPASLTPADPGGWSLLLVDDAHQWETVSGDGLSQLLELVRTTPGLATVVAADFDHARILPGDLVTIALENRTRVLLQPELADDGTLGFAIPYGGGIESLAGPGRGVLCTQGATRIVHFVTAEPEEEQIR